MNTKTTSLRRTIGREWNKANFRQLVIMIIGAFAINLALEMLSRQSMTEGWRYLVDRPWHFLYDALIILFTLSLSLLFRRRNFGLLLISCVWLGLGIANCILLNFRATPLTMPDILLLSSVRDIIEKYLNAYMIVLLMLLISVVIALIIFLWVRARKYKSSYYFAAVHILLIGTVTFVVTILLQNMGLISSNFPNLPEAYDANGFAYCISISALTQGIDKPSDYDAQAVENILDQQEDLPQSEKDTPNVVFVQLESFFDVNYLQDLTYEKNPVPNFTALKKTGSTGLFYVPSIGAGTANTEFEVLSGMNLDHFGVGEYPYRTIVRHRVCDSIAYTLRDLGYETHAIHNNNATFYSRDRVYANFGFDSFTSIEYMKDVQYNPLDWAKDTVLTEEILSALTSSDAKDLVFAVSVQPHGKYPTEPVDEAETIAVYGIDDPEREASFEYYLAQIWETDQFIGELIQALSTFDEPTVVVFYGDHLPSLKITQEELSKGTTQSTEYVIWSNFEIEKTDRDVQAYQLAAVVFDQIGIHDGALIRYHQNNLDVAEEDEQYQSELELLEYDILYGEHYYRTGEIEALQMRMGIKDITLGGVIYSESDGVIEITGKNFTPYSVILLNGEQLPTQFVSKEQLRAENAVLTQGDVLTVVQVSATNELVILSTSDTELVYKNE